MEYRYDPIMCMNIPVSSAKDSSRGHEIVVKTENYLRSLGKNNSIGKYDRVVQGVKSLLEEGYLEGPELDRAIKQETDRLLKKYNVKDFAGFVLKRNKGYELGVNSHHKLYIAFPGESMSNPHMLLGENNPENSKKAEELFNKFTKDGVMTTTYKTQTDAKDEKLTYGGVKRVKGGYIHFQKNNKGLYDVFYESDWNSSYNWTRYNQTEEQVIKTFTSNNEI